MGFEYCGFRDNPTIKATVFTLHNIIEELDINPEDVKMIDEGEWAQFITERGTFETAVTLSDDGWKDYVIDVSCEEDFDAVCQSIHKGPWH